MSLSALASRPFVRFLMVGVLNTLVGLGATYLLLHAFAFSYWGATFAGNTVGALFSYVMNRRFTFNSRQPVPRTLLLFALVILVCYGISFYAGLQVSRWIAGMLPSADDALIKDAAVIVSTGIYTITNYTGQKLLVFRTVRSSS